MRTRAKRRGSTIYRLMIAVEAPDWSHDEEASELLHKAFEATNYHVFTEDVLSMPDESGSAQSCASILLWPRRRDLDEAIKLAVATISPLVLQHCDLGDDPLDREVIRVLVQQEVFSNAFAPAEARPSGRTGSKRVRK